MTLHVLDHLFFFLIAVALPVEFLETHSDAAASVSQLKKD